MSRSSLNRKIKGIIAHKDKDQIHPRAMYIGEVSFENVGGVDRFTHTVCISIVFLIRT